MKQSNSDGLEGLSHRKADEAVKDSTGAPATDGLDIPNCPYGCGRFTKNYLPGHIRTMHPEVKSDGLEKQVIIDPTLTERQSDGYYFMSASCSNCNRPSGHGILVDVMIPLGQSKPLLTMVCPNCENRSLTV